jgi:hypothetical protein
MRRIMVMAVIAGAALALAGCGSSEGGDAASPEDQCAAALTSGETITSADLAACESKAQTTHTCGDETTVLRFVVSDGVEYTVVEGEPAEPRKSNAEITRCPPPTLDRDTEVAVQTCLTEMRGIGLALLELGSRSSDEAKDACDAAQTQLRVDSQGVVGPTVPRQLAVLLAERNVVVASAALKAATGTMTAEDAAALDASHTEWAEEVENLLNPN